MVESFERFLHGLRAEAPFRDELLDASPAHGDERELRGDEVAVGQHENGHRAQADPIDEIAVHDAAAPAPR